jgi:hypothetical protein
MTMDHGSELILQTWARRAARNRRAAWQDHGEDRMSADAPKTETAARHGLNLKHTLDAHLGWIEQLRQVLDGKTEQPVAVSAVACDDRCALGRWLHGTGRQRFGALPEFQELIQAHARFHTAAGLVLIEHKDGQIDKARQVFRNEMRAWSDQVQLGLARLFAFRH